MKRFINRLYWYKCIVNKIHENSVIKNPKAEADRVYYPFFRKKIDWENPKNLIEKIFWLQFNTDTSQWTRCADKYLVRDFIKEYGYSNYIPLLLGKWESVDDIDFSSFPKQFVLKSNNGCGTVYIVENKDEINIKKIKRKLKGWLNIPFGYSGAQLHYLRIKPCIIAEELLCNNEEDILISPNSLIDYKVYCINGEPEIIWVAYDRTSRRVYNTVYDKDWVKHPEYLVSNNHYIYNEKDISKPKCLDKILEISRNLSQSFKQVRVDFYVINEKPIIGELTFTTGWGFFTHELYDCLGSKIDLSKMATIRTINSV